MTSRQWYFAVAAVTMLIAIGAPGCYYLVASSRIAPHFQNKNGSLNPGIKELNKVPRKDRSLNSSLNSGLSGLEQHATQKNTTSEAWGLLLLKKFRGEIRLINLGDKDAMVKLDAASKDPDFTLPPMDSNVVSFKKLDNRYAGQTPVVAFKTKSIFPSSFTEPTITDRKAHSSMARVLAADSVYGIFTRKNPEPPDLEALQDKTWIIVK